MMHLQEMTLPGEALSLRDAVTLRGVGLHTGAASQVTLEPWPSRGWWLKDRAGAVVPLASACVVETQQATTIQLPSGQRWMTTEHVFAALSGLWLDAVCVGLSGDAETLEMPALDGSALPLVEAILKAGLIANGTRQAFALTQQTHISTENGETILLTPSAQRRMRYHVAYDQPLPPSAGDATWEGDHFHTQIAGARTFAFKPWVSALQARGLIRGGSLDNAVVFDHAQPLNPEGLRWPDEPARHKILDLLGDLAMLGAPLLADIEVTRGGHGLHAQALRALR